MPQRYPPLTMNPNAPVFVPAGPTGQQPAPILKKKAKLEDLSLEWDLKWPGSNDKKKKKKTPSPPTPTTPSGAKPPLVRLDRPLVPDALPPQTMPTMLPQNEPPPQIVQISPRNTPPRSSRSSGSPRVVIIEEPTRVHQRDYPARSNSARHYRNHHNHRGDDRGRGNHRGHHHDNRPRSPSPDTLRLRRAAAAELERQRAEQAIDERIRQLDADLTRRHQARRHQAREAEIARLDREIAELQRERDREHRARRNVRPMIHQADFQDHDTDDGGGWRRSWHGGGRGRERSRSSSRSRGRVRFGGNLLRGRRSSRSADRAGAWRGQRRLEDRSREYDLPFRRRSVSGARHWEGPRGRGERVVYDDNRGRGRW